MTQFATIYYDTERRQYCELVWSRAITAPKTNEDPILGRVEYGAWVLILPYLSQEALNMRKVCSYFVSPHFKQIYEATPIEFSEQVYLNVLDGLLSPERPLKTNTRFSYLPAHYEITPDLEFLQPVTCKTLALRMPRLTDLSTMILKGDYSFLGEAQSRDLHRIISRIWSCEDVPRWDIIHKFKALREFYCTFRALAYFMIGPAEGEFPAMRVLRLEGLIGIIPIFLDQMTGFLKTMPNLESLFFGVEQGRQTSGSLSLPSKSLEHLKTLELCGLNNLNSEDWRAILAAAPNIKIMILSGCSSPSEAFETLDVNDLPFLEKIRFFHMPVTLSAFSSLLKASPRLQKIELVYSDHVSDEIGSYKFKGESFPSVCQFTIQFSDSGNRGFRGRLNPFLKLLERMPNLETLTLLGCLLDHSFREISPGAYGHLKIVHFRDSDFIGQYLTKLFNAAPDLQAITFNNVFSRMTNNLKKETFSHVLSLEMKNGGVASDFLMDLLKKMPELRKLIMPKETIEMNAKVPFHLEPGSLPKLIEFRREWDHDNLTPEMCLEIIKAAPRLQLLSLPSVFLKEFSDLPDGFLSELRVFYGNKKYSSKPNQEKKYRKLLRIAPHVEEKS